MSRFRVRPESASDFAQVFATQRDAFGRHAEAHLVEALRATARPCVSLVAESQEPDPRVVGHVFFSPVRVGGNEHAIPGLYMGLAPVGVAPTWQGRGVGQSLCRAGLEACRELGAALVFVLGHPGYYPRFGFRAAETFGFTYGGHRAGPAFMVVELVRGARDRASGDVTFAPAFDALEDAE